MTARSIILGLLAGLFIAAFGYINDYILRLEGLNSGHTVPVVVFGLLIFTAAAVNPMLWRLRKKLAFRPAELAVSATMMMVCCSISSGHGVLAQFTQALALPAHWNLQRPGWRKNNLMQYVPREVLPASGRYDPEVQDGFLNGLARGGEFIGLDQIPWGKWEEPWTVWLPLLLLGGIASFYLALIVHRQWSSHERLRYPIALFGRALIERSPDSSVGAVFRSKMFWAALAVVAGIRLINALHAWYPQEMIRIPTGVSLFAIGQKFPIIMKTPLAEDLLNFRTYPIIIGFSYFLSSEISFTLGTSQLLFTALAIPLLAYGVDISTDYDKGGAMGWHRGAAYLAFALILLYTGRRYYWAVLKKALLFRSRDPIEAHATWACRIFLLCFVLMVGMLARLGLDLPLATLAVGFMLLSFVGVARITAETGLFICQPGWLPIGMLLGLFGGYAMGPTGLILVGMLCAVLCMDQSVALLPFLTNGLKLCEDFSVRPARVGLGATVTYVAGISLAVVVVLWANYNFGTPRDNWMFERTPTLAFSLAETEVNELELTGKLEESRQLGPLQRLINIRPKKGFIAWAGAGFLLVILFSFLRLRYSWWILHPVLFLVWATYPMTRLSGSFLLAWIIKAMVTRLGGDRAYRKAMPFMLGLVAGDILGAVIYMAVGTTYYGLTGLFPQAYRYLPR